MLPTQRHVRLRSTHDAPLCEEVRGSGNVGARFSPYHVQGPHISERIFKKECVEGQSVPVGMQTDARAR